MDNMNIIIPIIVCILCVNIAIATQTFNDSTYKITHSTLSGITTTDDSYKLSAVSGEVGIGNYTDTYADKVGFLYALVDSTESTNATEEEDTGPPPSSGGSAWIAQYGDCDILINPGNITFDIDTLDVDIDMKNTEDNVKYVNFHIPRIPTLYGKKNILKSLNGTVKLMPNTTHTVSFTITDNEGLIENTEVTVLAQTGFCAVKIPALISEPTSIFYDMKIDTDKLYYSKDDTVNIETTIVNKADKPDKDTQIKVYIIDPRNDKSYIHEEVLYEVDIGETVIRNSYYISEGMDSGKYIVGTEYHTEDQGILRSQTTFHVLPAVNIMLLYIGIIMGVVTACLLLIIFIIKKQDKKQ